MKRQTAAWIRKAEEDWQGACELAARNPPLRDLVCFHCQQAAEKYLKALLQEVGAVLPKTHNLKDLLKLLLPHDGALSRLKRGLGSLSRFAVDYRYPGLRATNKRMQSAIKQAGRVRSELRLRLGLEP
jgi:HEPN domain-containing protein